MKRRGGIRFRILIYIIECVYAILILACCIAVGFFDLSGWLFVPTFVLVAALVYAHILLRRHEQKYFEKKGYGIKALEKSGVHLDSISGTATFTLPDRKAIVDVVELEVRRRDEFLPYTRIRVQHSGEIPCVVDMPYEIQKTGESRYLDFGYPKFRFFDKDVYTEWIRMNGEVRTVGWPLVIPDKVKIRGSKVPLTLRKEIVPMATEWAKHILDDPNIVALQGYIMIQPDQVLCFIRGEWLTPEFLENAVNVLARLAQRIEKKV